MLNSSDCTAIGFTVDRFTLHEVHLILNECSLTSNEAVALAKSITNFDKVLELEYVNNYMIIIIFKVAN